LSKKDVHTASQISPRQREKVGGNASLFSALGGGTLPLYNPFSMGSLSLPLLCLNGIFYVEAKSSKSCVCAPQICTPMAWFLNHHYHQFGWMGATLIYTTTFDAETVLGYSHALTNSGEISWQKERLFALLQFGWQDLQPRTS